MLVKFTIISLFNDVLKPYLSTSMMWKATENGVAEFNFVNLREFGLGPHKKIDDTPYGGGDGMLMRCEPVFEAISSIKKFDPFAKVVVPTPSGVVWTEAQAKKFATAIITKEDFLEEKPARGPGRKTTIEAEREKALASREFLHYIILCPHYEGYDARIDEIVDFKFSLGYYVLTGGELPALIFIDSIVRLLPGVLGGENSAVIESFSDGENLEYPQYTKPETYLDFSVPKILLSGNHGKIDEWRKERAKEITNNFSNRELIDIRKKYNLTQEEIAKIISKSRATIIKIERDQSDLTVRDLEKIAKYLRVSILDLI